MSKRRASADPAGLLGRTVDDRFRTISFIGEGELGFVYQVEDLSWQRTCVLKILREEVRGDRTRLQRMLRDSRQLASMGVDMLVLADDVWVSKDWTGIVSPLLVGVDLGAFLRWGGGRLAWSRARELLLQIGAALSGLHRGGRGWGGLKPGNVYIERGVSGEFQVRLLDVMVSRHDPAAASAAYMAPECGAADPEKPADVYSLGVLAYEMLTGQPVFTGTPAQVVLMHRVKPPRALRATAPGIDVPPAVEQIVLRALEKDPRARPDIDGFLGVIRSAPAESGRSSDPLHLDDLTLAVPQGRQAATALDNHGQSQGRTMGVAPRHDHDSTDETTLVAERSGSRRPSPRDLLAASLTERTLVVGPGGPAGDSHSLPDDDASEERTMVLMPKAPARLPEPDERTLEVAGFGGPTIGSPDASRGHTVHTGSAPQLPVHRAAGGPPARSRPRLLARALGQVAHVMRRGWRRVARSCNELFGLRARFAPHLRNMRGALRRLGRRLSR